MSVSSLEGSPVPLDLAAKYQKITTEYAKIRAQCGVLKKAVVDERNQSAELKESLRVKDQSLRKAEQEIDSLSFRNQQLTKRVTILQDELDAVQNPLKKGKAKGTSRDIPNSILAEELQKKISDNAQLVSMLQEQSEKYESDKSKLVQSREVCEHELAECRKKLTSLEETRLARVESENRALAAKLAAKDEAVHKLCSEIKVLRNRARERGSSANETSEERRDKVVKLLAELRLDELLRGIIAFVRSFELRYRKRVSRDLVDEFGKCVDKNATAIADLVNSYSACSANVRGADDVARGFESLNGHVNSYIIVLDELNLYLTSGQDEDISQVFREIFASFKNLWIEFHSASKACALAAARASSPDDGEECVARLTNVFRSLRSACDYFSSMLIDGVEDEECGRETAATLSRLGAHSSAVYKKLSESEALLRSIVECRPAKGAETDGEDADGDGEECCEHWKRKYEAMNAAHSKRIKDLEEQISCLSGAATPRSSNSGNTAYSPVEGKERTEISNALGVLTGPPLASESQDSELIKYFNARANALVADRQLAESKVTALKGECESLRRRLEHSIERGHVLEASMKQTRDTVARLEEELTTTTTNYEVQLSSMSEHMANMNDRLAAQQGEIEILNYQLSEKGVKKGKSK